MALQTVNLTPLIGAELKTDIATQTSGKHPAEIAKLLEQCGALVLHEVHMNIEDQVAFSESLGSVQKQFDSPIQKISIDPKETFAADYLRDSFFWHIRPEIDHILRRHSTPKCCPKPGAPPISPTPIRPMTLCWMMKRRCMTA
jgi:hypothetical protein